MKNYEKFLGNFKKALSGEGHWESLCFEVKARFRNRAKEALLTFTSMRRSM